MKTIKDFNILGIKDRAMVDYYKFKYFNNQTVLSDENYMREFDRILKEKVKQYKPLNFNNMKAYIGTKIVMAEPMDRYYFINKVKNEDVSGENAPGYKVKYEDGYVSWSPKEVFENAYRLISTQEANMSFANSPGTENAEYETEEN